MVSGDIRITSGRLEIFHDFEWGTVYYGNFDDYAATVACRQLGYSTGISLGNIVRTGNGKVWLDDIKCTGVESKLTDCVIENWGITSRYHSGDVGIRCSNDSTKIIIMSQWKSQLSVRFRHCNSPTSVSGGSDCGTDNYEIKDCNTDNCPGMNQEKVLFIFLF
ncbi:LOXL2_3_4 [Mytilus coruscus]|uniref:LOXL2_3_4 n=1 Tax=Mytilus coruscus TaxID=42192 RepID=A0A6J8AIL0_MYTCO|nr:LOXL2_3_4 [Mytilus coruscus]